LKPSQVDEKIEKFMTRPTRQVDRQNPVKNPVATR